jgi:GT2 family glycosyltransferase
MHLAVITVVYNNYSNLTDFFASFDRQTDKNFHIFIADLSSQPRDIHVPAYVSVIKGRNGGYAYGLNLGLSKALEEDYSQYVFINDDTAVAEDFISQASRAIHENPGALIGGKIYYFPGNEFHKDRYKESDKGKVLWYAGGVMDWENAYAKHQGVDEVDTGQFDRPGETDFITGCLMMFDKELIQKAGRMDESYFLYYEDTDWNQQVKAARCPLMYDPKVIIWHKNSQSTGGSGSKLHAKYQRKNRVKFGLRYAPLRTKIHLVKNYLLGR